MRRKGIKGNGKGKSRDQPRNGKESKHIGICLSESEWKNQKVEEKWIINKRKNKKIQK